MTQTTGEVVAMQEFRTRGWALLPSYVDAPSRMALREEAQALIADPGAQAECQYYMDRFADGDVRLARVEAISGALPTLATSGLLDLLAQDAEAFLEGPVVLFKDKLNIRYPRSPGYAPHQDAARWSAFGPAFVSFGVFLDASEPDRGGFSFARYDLNAGLEATQTGDFDDARFAALPRQDIVAQAGDILAIDGRAPHCTTENASGDAVLHLLLTFVRGTDAGVRAAYYAAQEKAFDRVRAGNVFTFTARG